MNLFAIIDGDEKQFYGALLHYEKSNTFIIELVDTLDEWTAPLLFTGFTKQGIFTIPEEISALWVKDRIVPPGRQNINDILSTHKLKVYDEMKMLEITKGKCSQDNLYIERLDVLPEYVEMRQKKNLSEVIILKEQRILCMFRDGEVKVLSLAQLPQKYAEKLIKNERLFQTGLVGVGGYSVTFDGAVSIPAAVLYETGAELPLCKEDFLMFVQNNLLDTSESCDILGCSRQNLSYLLSKEQLTSVKSVNGNLYLKGDIISNQW